MIYTEFIVLTTPLVQLLWSLAISLDFLHSRARIHRLQPFKDEPVTGEMRVQITFEANKAST